MPIGRVGQGLVVVGFDEGEDVGLTPAGVGLLDAYNLAQAATTVCFLPGSAETSA
jgi:hypothetical protein